MINQVIIEGRVTHNPELKIRNNDLKVVQVSIASHKDNDNEKVNFIDVVLFNKTAENFAKFIKKGDKIVVIGSLDTSDYTDRSNIKRKATTVICNKVYYPPKVKTDDYCDNVPIPTE